MCAEEESLSCALSPFKDRLRHSWLGKKKGKDSHGEMQRRSERGMREGKTKRTGRERVEFHGEGENS